MAKRGVLGKIAMIGRLLRREGVGGTARRVFLRLATSSPVLELAPMVSERDMLAADWTRPPERLRSPVRVTSESVEVAWITSSPSAASGGHQNMFRFIHALEEAGHRCRVYLYDWRGASTPIREIREMLRSSAAYPEIGGEILPYDREAGVVPSTQALVATSWETAYPAFLDLSPARRFYFVQDFEPAFFPAGSTALLAENTYRFGFHGLTAGAWLAHRLSTDYGMSVDHYDFAADREIYTITNTGSRRALFYYARPSTARRAFEVGAAALANFASTHPDVTIHVAGTALKAGRLRFPHRNHGNLDLIALNALYNECAAGLVLSLTNMSLLPLELIAAGVTPVVNDAPNNRMVSDNPFIEYVEPSPARIADRLRSVVDRPDHGERAMAMAASLDGLTWGRAIEQFVTAFERVLRG